MHGSETTCNLSPWRNDYTAKSLYSKKNPWRNALAKFPYDNLSNGNISFGKMLYDEKKLTKRRIFFISNNHVFFRHGTFKGAWSSFDNCCGGLVVKESALHLTVCGFESQPVQSFTFGRTNSFSFSTRLLLVTRESLEYDSLPQ